MDRNPVAFFTAMFCLLVYNRSPMASERDHHGAPFASSGTDGLSSPAVASKETPGSSLLHSFPPSSGRMSFYQRQSHSNFTGTSLASCHACDVFSAPGCSRLVPLPSVITREPLLSRSAHCSIHHLHHFSSQV